MKNIFLQKSYSKGGGEASRRPFSEKLSLNILWINSLKLYTVCFAFIPSCGLSKYIEAKLQTARFYVKLSFSKNKKKSRTRLPASFSV